MKTSRQWAKELSVRYDLWCVAVRRFGWGSAPISKAAFDAGIADVIANKGGPMSHTIPEYYAQTGGIAAPAQAKAEGEPDATC